MNTSGLELKPLAMVTVEAHPVSGNARLCINVIDADVTALEAV